MVVAVVVCDAVEVVVCLDVASDVAEALPRQVLGLAAGRRRGETRYLQQRRRCPIGQSGRRIARAHGLVMLHGDRVVAGTVLGLASGNTTLDFGFWQPLSLGELADILVDAVAHGADRRKSVLELSARGYRIYDEVAPLALSAA